jgi:hypothetical protein
MRQKKRSTHTLKKPSEQAEAVLRGKLAMELVHPAVQSMLRLQIYEGACEILKLPQGERRAALGKIPALIRPHVEEEVVRLWRDRNDV